MHRVSRACFWLFYTDFLLSFGLVPWFPLCVYSPSERIELLPHSQRGEDNWLCTAEHQPLSWGAHWTQAQAVNGILGKAQGIALLQETKCTEEQECSNPALLVRASACLGTRECAARSPWAELQPFPAQGPGNEHPALSWAELQPPGTSFGPAPPNPGVPPATAAPWCCSWCFAARCFACQYYQTISISLSFTLIF